MEPVGNLSSIIEVLRRQIADNAAKIDRTGRSGAGGRAPVASKTAQPTIQQLRETIKERIQHLDRNAPDYGRSVKRAFLEAVISWEFGNEILLDQGYGDMLSDIQSLIEADESLQKQFEKLYPPNSTA